MFVIKFGVFGYSTSVFYFYQFKYPIRAFNISQYLKIDKLDTQYYQLKPQFKKPKIETIYILNKGKDPKILY